jgi:hypothetical protein
MLDSDEPLRPELDLREIEVDEEPEPPARKRGASTVTWIVLAVGLALTVVLAKFGIWFLFLPIIIPFGLGGRALVGRLSGSSRRRTLRLEGSKLGLYSQALGGVSREASLDVSEGVFVAVSATELRAGDRFAWSVRFVSAGGSFDVPVSDVGHAREVRERAVAMLSRAGVRIANTASEVTEGPP